MMYALEMKLGMADDPIVNITSRRIWQSERVLEFHNSHVKVDKVVRFNTDYWISESPVALRDFAYRMIDQQIRKLRGVEIKGYPRKGLGGRKHEAD